MASTKITVIFWIMTPCRQVKLHRRFGKPYFIIKSTSSLHFYQTAWYHNQEESTLEN